MVKDLAEVLEYVDRSTSTIEDALAQDRAVFLVLMEIIRVPWNMIANLPDALSSNIASAVERVEGCR